MPKSSILVKTILLLAGSVLITSSIGGQCPGPAPFPPPGAPIPPPPPPPPPPQVLIVEVELVNVAGAAVDPGLFVDGGAIIIDPPIAPGEIVVLEVDCFVGTILETDALLLTGFGAIPSENAPFLEEGFEFLCEDIVSFIFVEDAFGFFTNVEVNGYLLP